MEEKHFYYAEINENNICTALLDTPTEITDNARMILTDTYDLSVLGKKYNSGKWEEIESNLLSQQNKSKKNKFWNLFFK